MGAGRHNLVYLFLGHSTRDQLVNAQLAVDGFLFTPVVRVMAFKASSLGCVRRAGAMALPASLNPRQQDVRSVLTGEIEYNLIIPVLSLRNIYDTCQEQNADDDLFHFGYFFLSVAGPAYPPAFFRASTIWS